MWLHLLCLLQYLSPYLSNPETMIFATFGAKKNAMKIHDFHSIKVNILIMIFIEKDVFTLERVYTLFIQCALYHSSNRIIIDILEVCYGLYDFERSK